MNIVREACPHDEDLGTWMSEEDIITHVCNAREHPAVRAILQKIRTKAALMGKEGRTIPEDCQNPADFRAFHDGAQEGLEELFWELIGMRKTELDKELEESESSADETGAL